MTKVAFGCDSIEILADRLESRVAGSRAVLTTRYLPKRAEEMVGGSLFWIVKHQLVGRSPILEFGEAEGGRTAIYLDPNLILVHPLPKRAHQGWRYLEDANAPKDLSEGSDGADTLPPELLRELSTMGLV